MGGALAIALDRGGFEVAELVHRGGETAREIARNLTKTPSLVEWDSFSEVNSDVVVISSGDPEIAAIGEHLAAIGDSGIVLHTSGSLSSDVLTAARDRGFQVGSMHPLISISDPVVGSESFAGAYFCVEGDTEAVATAEVIVDALGGKTFSISTENKPLYHASAVTASGHLVALIDTAVEMLSKCDLEKSEAKNVLMPLIESTIKNFTHQTSDEALTGSFSRGDKDAVERHLKSFEGRVSSEIREIYLALGQRSLEIASRREPESDRLRDMAEFISLAKQNSGC
jgi:predicted short-subunit dehydrogenase-like oxidoreductase (DUF2520 family)